MYSLKKRLWGLVCVLLAVWLGGCWALLDTSLAVISVGLNFEVQRSAVAQMIQFVGDILDICFGWTTPLIVTVLFFQGLKWCANWHNVNAFYLTFKTAIGLILGAGLIDIFFFSGANTPGSFLLALPILWLEEAGYEVWGRLYFWVGVAVLLALWLGVHKLILFLGRHLIQLFRSQGGHKAAVAVAAKKEDKDMPVKKPIKKRIETIPGSDVSMRQKNLPPLSLLPDPSGPTSAALGATQVQEMERQLVQALQEFGVQGEVTKVTVGPVVCVFDFIPAAGVKVSRVVGVTSDVSRTMCASSVRVAAVPGSNALGIEVPHNFREQVELKPLLAEALSTPDKCKIPLVLGKDITSKSVVADLAKMPHLLVAGTTGSGKSVGLNAMILSLLFRFTAQQCRFIMIDPKVLELSIYEGIPHLLTSVVTQPADAIRVLKWLVQEMEERYRLMAQVGVRNLESFNAMAQSCAEKSEPIRRKVQVGYDESTGSPCFETHDQDAEELPYIVTIVDEMADLMLTAGKEVEILIQRLAQKARAAGIHVITATQRPSVDVITGTIKANFPARVVFQVSSKIDSRTALGEQGAENLVGRGDMLYMSGGGHLTRVHGPFVADGDIQRVVNWLRHNVEPPSTQAILLSGDVSEKEGSDTEGDLYQQALNLVVDSQRASTSFIQRKLQIGYNRAADLMESLEDNGIVSPADHVGRRQVLRPKEGR